MAESLRVEHPNAGLRGFNLEPGTVVTEAMKAAGITEEVLKRFKPCTPAAIAAVVAWLADNEPQAEWEREHILRGPAIAKLPRLIGLSRAKEISFTGRPVFAQQAYEWGLVNHVVPEDELLPTAIALAEDMCACVPQILEQYKPLIEDGYSMPYKQALAWEEQQAIESAKRAFASTIAGRRDDVINRGRSELDEG